MAENFNRPEWAVKVMQLGDIWRRTAPARWVAMRVVATSVRGFGPGWTTGAPSPVAINDNARINGVPFRD